MRQGLVKLLDRIALALLYCGGLIVLIQAVWISYGVFMRYGLNSPDGTVTEATALLLVPVAFFGLAYALTKDAFPKVTLIRDTFPVKLQIIVDRINLVVMLSIGLFFSLSAARAAFRAFHSGASSEILLWPRFYFWVPVAISLAIFTLIALVRLINYEHPSRSSNTTQEIS